MITPKSIGERVERIRQKAGDPEAAHAMEDMLHTDVLKAIAHGECEDPRTCANTALMTLGIDFERWCA